MGEAREGGGGAENGTAVAATAREPNFPAPGPSRDEFAANGAVQLANQILAEGERGISSGLDVLLHAQDQLCEERR